MTIHWEYKVQIKFQIKSSLITQNQSKKSITQKYPSTHFNLFQHSNMRTNILSENMRQTKTVNVMSIPVIRSRLKANQLAAPINEYITSVCASWTSANVSKNFSCTPNARMVGKPSNVVEKWPNSGLRAKWYKE